MEGAFPLHVPHFEKEEQARPETVGDFPTVDGGARHFRIPHASRKDTLRRTYEERMTHPFALSGRGFLRAVARDFRLTCY